MADETLILLADEVRSKTLKLIKGLSDADSLFHAPHLTNPILWHAGHALIVVEHLCVAAATKSPPIYPAGWFETFSWMSKPAMVTKWPSVEEVAGRLSEQLERLKSAISTLSEVRLDEIIDAPRNRTLRYSILHGLHDEANHQGEMHLLKKLAAKSSGKA
jgi:hypothetical protein